MPKEIKRVYDIAGVRLLVQGMFLDECWKTFQLESRTEQIDTKIEVLSRAIERYNLESIQLKEKEVYCFRHGPEVMLVDKEWKNVRILPPVDMEIISRNLNPLIYKGFGFLFY